MESFISRLFTKKENVKKRTVKVKAYPPPSGHYAIWELKTKEFEIPASIWEEIAELKIYLSTLECIVEHHLILTKQIEITIKPEAQI